MILFMQKSRYTEDVLVSTLFLLITEKTFDWIVLFVRQSDRYYNDGIMVPDTDTEEGIDNARVTNAYEYTEKIRTPVSMPARTNSASSFRTESGVSLKEMQGFMSSSPSEDYPRKGTPVFSHRQKKETQFMHGVPQTDVWFDGVNVTPCSHSLCFCHIVSIYEHL